MMPHAAPTTRFSAIWQSAANSSPRTLTPETYTMEGVEYEKQYTYPFASLGHAGTMLVEQAIDSTDAAGRAKRSPVWVSPTCSSSSG